MFNWNFLNFTASQLSLVLSLGTAERCLAPSSLVPHQTSTPKDKTPPPSPSPLQAEQPHLSQPSLTSPVLQPLGHLCSLCWTRSSLAKSLLPTGTWTPMCLRRAEQRGRVTASSIPCTPLASPLQGRSRGAQV